VLESRNLPIEVALEALMRPSLYDSNFLINGRIDRGLEELYLDT
jgi:hypothetical protein